MISSVTIFGLIALSVVAGWAQPRNVLTSADIQHTAGEVKLGTSSQRLAASRSLFFATEGDLSPDLQILVIQSLDPDWAFTRFERNAMNRQVVANSLLALGYLAMKPIELEVRLVLVHKLTEIIDQAADGDVRIRALFYLRALERTETTREAREARVRALQAARNSPDERVQAWARNYLSEECEYILQN